MRILIVDDELVSRAKMKKIMSRYGQCDEAEDGIQAMDKIFQAKSKGFLYALMTLDVDMPKMSGMQVLARIREMEQEDTLGDGPSPMKIVMVTAMGDRETFSQSLLSGCDEYIIKPFHPETIHRQMRILGVSCSASLIQGIEA
ncbi:response regulator [Desulfocicer niacini]